MTTSDHDPKDAIPPDAEFDAAWRAASREEPPPAIDAAILAAARRAADAGPTRSTPGDGRAERPGAPARWWRPLAVAATLGAIAVGLLQLVSPDRIGTPGRDGSVVSDMPPAPFASRSAESARQEPAKNAVANAPVPERAAAPLSPSTPAASQAPTENRPLARLRERDADVVPPSSAPLALRKDSALADAREPAPFVPLPASPASSARAPQVPLDAMEEPSPGATVAEPFPAADAKRERSEIAAKRAGAAPPAAPPAASTVAPAPAALAAAPAPMASAAAPAPAASGGALSHNTVDSVGSSEQRASGGRAQGAPQAAGATFAERAPPSAQASDTRQAAQISSPKIASKVVNAQPGAAEAQDTTRAPLSVPDWIAKIRRLIVDGRYDDAAKELAGFNAAHPDHERLLPPDLRDWRPPVR